MMAYTEEETNYLKQQVNPGANPDKDTIASLAKALDKSTRSIISKLRCMGLYKAVGYLSKTGLPPTTKEEIVEEIAKAMQCTSEELLGLEKANKTTLMKLLERLKQDKQC